MKKSSFAHRVSNLLFYSGFGAAVAKVLPETLHNLRILKLVEHIELFGCGYSFKVAFHEDAYLPP
jgi:hypothetical protein